MPADGEAREALAGLPAGYGVAGKQRKDVEEVQKLEKSRERYYREEGGAEEYEPIVENAFLPAKSNALSTFSIDVDTASYANVRRFLTGGSLPPPSAVRIEELINYFNYNDEQPKGNAPFAVHIEVAECPWTPGHHLLRIGLKGKEIAKDKRPNSNLVFLLDVSGSMQAHNKLPLVKEAMSMLTRELTENDMVTIVVYAGQEGMALDTTSGDQKDKIIGAINNLSAGGSTHASAGITLAYEMAQKNFLKEGTNRVILCTDGDFNVGITDDESLVKLISEKAKSNIFLSVLGFGMGNLKDGKMEKLADKGNGNYAYIDTSKEAKKVLVEQMTGSLVTIAKDVKIQIEFNPAMVSSYRQIGYENRVLAAKDFDDDTKDAGEIGAGHSVTALYEVVLTGQEEKAAAPATVEGVPLKYQKAPEKKPEPKPEGLTDAAATGELLTVKLRFKEPTGDKSELIEFPLKQEPKRFGAASENLRFAAAVAEFGMLLRNSQYRGGATLSAVEEIATAASSHDPSGYRAEFVELVKKAEGLK
jgi:Ca-activated chloride channel family protein